MRKTFFSACAISLIIALASMASDQLGDSTNPPVQAVDAYGDPLPAGAVARLGSTRWRTFQSSLAFSPDGKLAVAVTRDLRGRGIPGTRLLEVATGKTLRGFDIDAQNAHFMADNKTVILATGFPASLLILDLETGKIVRKIPTNGYYCRWSTDGKTMVCLTQNKSQDAWQIAIWDLGTGVETRKLDITGQIAISPNGKTFAVRAAYHISLHDVADGKELRRSPTRADHAGGIPTSTRLAFAPDGKTLASTVAGPSAGSEWGGVALWDCETGKPIPKGTIGASLRTGKEDPVTLAFSPDGRFLAAGCHKGGLYLWDLTSNKIVHTWPDAGNMVPIYLVNFAPDSKTLICQTHGSPSARLWDVASGKELPTSEANLTQVQTLTFGLDGKTIATDGDSVRLWEPTSGKLVHRLVAKAAGELVFLVGGRSLAIQSYSMVTVWNFEDDNLRFATLPEVPNNQTMSLFCTNRSLDAKTLVAAFPGDVKRVIRMKGQREEITIRWTMIGQLNLNTTDINSAFRVEPEQIMRLQLSANRKTVFGLDLSWLYEWDLAKKAEVFRMSLPQEHNCREIWLSTEAKTAILYTGGSAGLANRQHSFYFLELATKKVGSVYQHKTDTSSGSISLVASEELAAIAQMDTIVLLSPRNGKELGRFKSGGARIIGLAFSPDAKLLASSSDDTTALIWDVDGLINGRK